MDFVIFCQQFGPTLFWSFVAFAGLPLLLCRGTAAEVEAQPAEIVSFDWSCHDLADHEIEWTDECLF
jgi:hypothetical protein